MKKLMIAAALAAACVGAEAKTYPQVYDMTITLKTSWCNKKGDRIVKFADYKGDLFVYRTQITRKLAGAFWGCDCDVIGAPLFWGNCKMEKTEINPDTGLPVVTPVNTVRPTARDGFIFWDATDKVGFWDTESETSKDPVLGEHDLFYPWAQTFEWNILNVIGKKSANVEGYWTLAIANKVDGKDLFDADGTLKSKSGMVYLEGAGYGSAKIYNAIPELVASVATDANYIKTMKGYTVGYLALKDFTKAVGCLYCGTEVNCDAFRFCACEYCSKDDTTQYAPAFGTWTLTYNSSAVSKLKAGQSIVTADTKILKLVRDWMPRMRRGYMNPLAKAAEGKAGAYANTEKDTTITWWDWAL